MPYRLPGSDVCVSFLASYSIYREEGFTLFMQLIVGALMLSLIIPIKLVIKSTKYALRMRHKHKNE